MSLCSFDALWRSKIRQLLFKNTEMTVILSSTLYFNEWKCLVSLCPPDPSCELADHATSSPIMLSILCYNTEDPVISANTLLIFICIQMTPTYIYSRIRTNKVNVFQAYRKDTHNKPGWQILQLNSDKKKYLKLSRIQLHLFRQEQV